MDNSDKFTLQEAVYWLTFGHKFPIAAEVIENETNISNAKQKLRKALVDGLLRASGTKYVYQTGGEYRQIKQDTFLVRKSDYIDYKNNKIYSTSGSGMYFDPRRIETSIFVGDITITLVDLRKQFATNNEKHNVSPMKISHARPVSRTKHDIAYFFWKSNKNLPIKVLSKAMEEVFYEYPDLNKGKAVSLTSLQKWKTDFTKNKYQPITPKEKLAKQYCGIFSKLNKAV